MLMDVLISYAPSPVKPLFYLARRFPLAVSLGIGAAGGFVLVNAASLANVASAARAATNKEPILKADDVATVGWTLVVLGALYPAFRLARLANEGYVRVVHGKMYRAIRAVLEQTVHGPGGLLYAAVRYRGVVVEAFDRAHAMDQIQKQRIDVSEAGLRSEYRRLARSIDAVVGLTEAAVRETRQGHMHRLILDVLHGGILYEQVHGPTYLMGCVVDQDYMEPANGALPRAIGEMERMLVSLRKLLRGPGRYSADGSIVSGSRPHEVTSE
jgi:hypothetical protein